MRSPFLPFSYQLLPQVGKYMRFFDFGFAVDLPNRQQNRWLCGFCLLGSSPAASRHFLFDFPEGSSMHAFRTVR